MSPKTINDPKEWIRSFQLSPPVDVKRMADELGIKIWELETMPTGASGKLFPDRRSAAGWSIGVNKSEPNTRKRFTIAHEMAHFLLHKGELRSGVLDDTLYRSEHLSGAQETEANKFAADILMPFHLLNRFAGNVGSLDELAKKFEVSRQALSVRLGIPLP
jgi:Zn-dependent peptidase ImmA (M78 family)